MIKVESISKKYKKVTAIKDVSLTAYPGEVSVILGPNGAGKSTTIKCIVGLLNYEGNIYISGHSNKSCDAKRILGYIPEVPSLYDLLTVWEHIKYISKAYRLQEGWEQQALTLLERLEIADKKNVLSRELSKGMTQKLSIIVALIIKPQVIVFDEPLVGLDPKAIVEVTKILEELKAAGTAVLLSTHIIDTVNDVWDRAFIMDKGHIIKEVVRSELKNQTLKELFFSLTGGDSQ